MPNDSADLIGSLNKKVDSIESSVANLKERQCILEEKYAFRQDILNERIIDKEHTINQISDMGKAIKDQNDALQKQISGRWSLVTGMMSFVAIMFALNYAYELYKVKEVMEAKTFLEKGSKELALEAANFSFVLSELAQADVLVAEANREFQRAAYVDTLRFALRATEILNAALERTGISVRDLKSAYQYDRDSCKLVSSGPVFSISRTRLPQEDGSASVLKIGLNIDGLQQAVKTALFTSYDMQARASFFMHDTQPLREQGVIMLALDGSRWEGYHWIGLAAENEKMFDEAITCLDLSIAQKPRANKDYINMSEIYFVQGKYTPAKRYAEAYVKGINYLPVSNVDIIAAFYFSLAEYLSHSQVKLLPPAALRSKLKDIHFKLDGTFDPKDLMDYLRSPSFNEDLKEYEKKEVSATVYCLLEKKCV